MGMGALCARNAAIHLAERARGATRIRCAELERGRCRPRGTATHLSIEIGGAVVASVVMALMVAGGGAVVERTAGADRSSTELASGVAPLPRTWCDWIGGTSPVPRSWHEPD